MASKLSCRLLPTFYFFLHWSKYLLLKLYQWKHMDNSYSFLKCNKNRTDLFQIGRINANTDYCVTSILQIFKENWLTPNYHEIPQRTNTFDVSENSLNHLSPYQLINLLHALTASLMGLTASLVTTGRMQQGFNVSITDIQKCICSCTIVVFCWK